MASRGTGDDGWRRRGGGGAQARRCGVVCGNGHGERQRGPGVRGTKTRRWLKNRASNAIVAGACRGAAGGDDSPELLGASGGPGATVAAWLPGHLAEPPARCSRRLGDSFTPPTTSAHPQRAPWSGGLAVPASPSARARHLHAAARSGRLTLVRLLVMRTKLHSCRRATRPSLHLMPQTTVLPFAPIAPCGSPFFSPRSAQTWLPRLAAPQPPLLKGPHCIIRWCVCPSRLARAVM